MSHLRIKVTSKSRRLRALSSARTMRMRTIGIAHAARRHPRALTECESRNRDATMPGELVELWWRGGGISNTDDQMRDERGGRTGGGGGL